MRHAPAPIGSTTDRPRRADGTLGVWATCDCCGVRFACRVDRANRPHLYCSRKCCDAAAAARNTELQGRFIHQSDDRAKKVRANGLINMRIRRGTIVRPERCERCGKGGRLDACHVDYDRPDVVAFACRSCHMKSHHDPRIAAELEKLARSRGGTSETEAA